MNTIILPAPLIRAAMACQAKKDVRFYLNGILLAKNGDIVGTNGHILFKGHSPALGAAGLEQDMIVLIDGTIPATAETVTLTYQDERNGVCTTDNKKAFTFTVNDGTYPDYIRVIPTLPRREHSTGFGVDATYLAAAEKTFGKGATMAVYPGGAFDPVLMRYIACNPPKNVQACLEDSLMVVMPTRVDQGFEPLFANNPESKAA